MSARVKDPARRDRAQPSDAFGGAHTAGQADRSPVASGRFANRGDGERNRRKKYRTHHGRTNSCIWPQESTFEARRIGLFLRSRSALLRPPTTPRMSFGSRGVDSSNLVRPRLTANGFGRPILAGSRRRRAPSCVADEYVLSTGLGATRGSGRRCPDFFADATLVPSLEPEARRPHERAMWAKTTGEAT